MSLRPAARFACALLLSVAPAATVASAVTPLPARTANSSIVSSSSRGTVMTTMATPVES